MDFLDFRDSLKSREFEPPETMVLCFLMNASAVLCFNGCVFMLVNAGYAIALAFFNFIIFHNLWSSEFHGFPGIQEFSEIQRIRNPGDYVFYVL